MAESLAWWLVLQVIGLLALPIAFVLFRRLPDRGYAFAKPLGLLLGGYLFWLAGSLHLLPNRPGSIVWVLIAIALVSFVLFRSRRAEMEAALRDRWGLVLAIEAVFTIAFFAGAHLKTYLPEITATEKPMDFLFLNAASRSRFFPPDDPWFAGEGVSYYYFGYLLQAMLGKLTGVATAYTFNLGLVTTAALAATAAFGLGYNLVALRRGTSFAAAAGTGAAAALLLTVLGNLEGVLEFGRANGLLSEGFYGSTGVAGLVGAGESATWYPTEQSSHWWWWRATRIITDPPGTISEFPFFSFLLGDLHPHVMAIPYALTALALALALWRSDGALTADAWRRSPLLHGLCAVIIGGLGFLNSWDLPTFGFVVALLVVLRNYAVMRDPLEAAARSAGFLAPLAMLAALLYLPFYLGFSSQASGLDTVRGGGSRLLHLALFWAPLLLLALALPVRDLWRERRSFAIREVGAALAAPALVVLLWGLLVTAESGVGALAEAVRARGWNWLTALLLSAALVTTSLAFWRQARAGDERDPGAAPAMAFTATALLLVFGAEFFHVRDVFGSRLNTVFKLYYQAWLLLAIGAAFSARTVLAATLRSRPRPAAGLVWAPLAAAAVAGALLYPLGATLSRTEGLTRGPRTLDGLAFPRAAFPDDYAAARWLAERAGPGERMVEAVDGQYSHGGRISSWTGVPTVLGWPGHERQWGRELGELARRQADVEAAYKAPTLREAIEILRRYAVTYVVVGNLERSKYPAALDKFKELPAVFANGATSIYRLPANPEADGALGLR